MKAIFSFVSLAILLSCGNSKKQSSNIKDDSKNTTIKKAIIGDVQKKSDPFEINSVSIEGNNMTIEARFSGGCKNHEFELIGSMGVMKSFPPQRSIALIHKSNNDKCEAYLTKKIQFDISELAASKQNGDEIYLILNDKSYSYKYKLEKK